MFGDDRIEGIELHVARRFPHVWNNIEVWLRGHGFKALPSNKYYCIKNIEFEEVTDRDYRIDKFQAFMIDDEAAQILMNELWDCGLRPSQAAGSAGQLDAVKAHLDDLKKILWNRLKIEED